MRSCWFRSPSSSGAGPSSRCTSSSSAWPCTTRRWQRSTPPASAARRSPRSRPGRRSCSRSRSHASAGTLFGSGGCRSGSGSPTGSRSPSRSCASSTPSCRSRRSTASPDGRRWCSPSATTSFPWPRTSSAARSGWAARTSAGWRGPLLGTAGLVATLGLLDVYLIPIGWWRTNGVVDYFHKHLGYVYHGTGENPRVAGLPENFVFNVGGDKPFLRRLVSTFLSPLASSYLFVVALVGAAALVRRRRTVAIVLVAVAAAGLLWTFSRVVAARRRGRARRARGRAAQAEARSCRCGRRRGGGRLGASLPADRADRELDEGGSRVPARRRRRASGRVELGDERQRVVTVGALAEPEGRDPHGDPPSAGLRPRQRRPDRLAHRDAAEGRRVELHGARRGGRRPRCGALRRVVRRAPRRARPRRPRGPAGRRRSRPRSRRCSRSRSRRT